jgi:hypothetical protein
MAYFAVHERHPDWAMTHLRTTSRLERCNRGLRRRARAASAYHSDASLQARDVPELRLQRVAAEGGSDSASRVWLQWRWACPRAVPARHPS